jgi:hypothetical protein
MVPDEVTRSGRRVAHPDGKGERKAKAFKRDHISTQAAMPIHPGLKEANEILMGVGDVGVDGFLFDSGPCFDIFDDAVRRGCDVRLNFLHDIPRLGKGDLVEQAARVAQRVERMRGRQGCKKVGLR